MVSSDLSANIFGGLYLLFSHNALVLAYFTGLLGCGVLSFFKPSRVAFLFTASFAILVFSFEYDKHIIEGLRAQTLATLAPTPGTHLKTVKLIDLFLSEFLPVCFFVFGWLTLLGTISYCIFQNIHEKSSHLRE